MVPPLPLGHREEHACVSESTHGVPETQMPHQVSFPEGGATPSTTSTSPLSPRRCTTTATSSNHISATTIGRALMVVNTDFG